MRKNIKRPLPLLIFLGLLLPIAGFAQLPISLGVKGGWPLTYALSDSNGPGLTRFYSNSREFIVGPMVELRLPLRLSVEADALYHPFNVTTGSTNGSAVLSDTSYSVWEFPILVKYHFGGHFLDPFVGVGPEFRTQPGGLFSQNITNISSGGLVLAAGLDFKLKIIRISPEIRYTHWGGDSAPAAPVATVSSNQNQAAFLVGLTF
jgi:outer membrane protein W